MIFYLLLIFSSVEANTLELDKVVASSLKHYPKVIEASFFVEQEKSELQNVKGEGFDSSVSVYGDKRYSGYYNGESLKAKVKKPLQILNSEIYGGYRVSDGEYPIYEGKTETLSNGEAFMGVSLSLLRNSLIDLRRYRLWNSELDLDQSRHQLEKIKIDVQTAAIKAYWTWVVKSWELNLYTDILSLAKTRQESIRIRVKAGDLAEIFQSENDLYINERLANFKEAEMEYQVASFYLSLFYRDDKGQPIPIQQNWVPDYKTSSDADLVLKPDYYERQALSRSLELKILESQIKQSDLEYSLGRNYLRPKVDLKLEWSEDYGQGDQSFDSNETRAFLNFSVPIEYNKGLGKSRAAKAKRDQLKFKKKLTVEKIKVQNQSLMSKINNTESIVEITKKQVALSEKLAKAELAMFKQGSSDLLKLNLREDKLAKSRLKNLEYILKYHYFIADLKNLTLDLHSDTVK